MAVFGLPRLHEDDALRAVRAADGDAAALAALNDGARQRWGVGSRTGPASTPARWSPATRRADQRLVTGDAVNIAARLEQAAPHERGAHRRARPTGSSAHASRSRRSSRSTLKGKAERVPAYRLARASTRPRHRAAPRPPARRARRASWPSSSAAFDAALERPSRAGCVTVVGEAGVGKSRLVEEFGQAAGERPRSLRAAAFPTARASRSGRWSRSSARRPRSPTTTRRPGSREDRAPLGRRPTGRWSSGSRPRSGCRPRLPGRRSSSGACGGCSRRSPRERPLVVVLRRHPLGRDDVARPDRAPARDVQRRDRCPARLHRAPRLARAEPDVARGTERSSRSSRSPRTTAVRVIENVLGAGLAPAHQRPDRRGGRGQPAVRRAVALDAHGRRRAARGRRGVERRRAISVELPIPPTIHALLAARLDKLSRRGAGGDRARRRSSGRVFARRHSAAIVAEAAPAAMWTVTSPRSSRSSWCSPSRRSTTRRRSASTTS